MKPGRFSSGSPRCNESHPNPLGREKTCLLCTRDSESASGLCRYHAAAEENLRDAYKRWRLAYGGMVWKIYLERIIQLPGAGVWAKDVAQHELKVDGNGPEEA